MAHRDGPRSDGQPLLSGYWGHQAIFGARRSVGLKRGWKDGVLADSNEPDKSGKKWDNLFA
jgi:hypothetical protein